jgi:murein DD-endopeptidase MepM/ murein hydrolase activator NlpD
LGKKDKKAYQAYLKAHKGKGSSGNSFLSTNTNKSKKEVKKRVKAVRKSTPKKSGSQAYREYQNIHSGNGSTGNTFLSTNANKSKKEVKRRVQSVSTPSTSSQRDSYEARKKAANSYLNRERSSTSRLGNTFQATRETAKYNPEKRERQQSIEKKRREGIQAVENRYAKTSSPSKLHDGVMSEQQTEPIHEKQVKIENEITEQNRQRAKDYMEQESSGQKQHEGKFNGTKNANQQEAVRGMAEVKKNNQDRIEAEKVRKNLQAKQKESGSNGSSQLGNNFNKDVNAVRESVKNKSGKYYDEAQRIKKNEETERANQAASLKRISDKSDRQVEIENQKKLEETQKQLSKNRSKEKVSYGASPMEMGEHQNGSTASRRMDNNRIDLSDTKLAHADERLSDATVGTGKQIVGGFAKTAGDVADVYTRHGGASVVKANKFEEDRFINSQIQRKDVSEGTKNTLRGVKEGYNNAEEYMRSGGMYNPGKALYSVGEKIQASGDKQVEKSMEGLTRFEKILMGAYTSGLGTAADMSFGPYWAVSMAARTYGNTRGSAEAQGATVGEDRLYSVLQALKETGTEYMFAGAGLASKLTGAGAALEKTGLGALKSTALDRLAVGVGNRFGNVAANVAYSGAKLALGGTEEATEELVGGLLDAPITNLSYGNAVDERREKSYREMLLSGSDNLEDRISNEAAQYGVSREELAKVYGEDINSKEFLEEQIQSYVDSGMSQKQAASMAEKMQQYLSASISGDSKKAKKLEDEMTADYMKMVSVKQKFSASETLDAMASAYIMTAVTGVATNGRALSYGANVRDSLKQDYAMKSMRGLDDNVSPEILRNVLSEKVSSYNTAQAMADIAVNVEDSKIATRAQAIKDTANEGTDIALEQYADMAHAINVQMTKNSESIQTARNLAMRKVENENLDAGADRLINGSSKVAQKHGDEVVKRVTDTAVEMNKSFDEDRQLDDVQIGDVARAAGNLETGTLNPEDVETLMSNKTEEREVFEKATGEKLPQILNSDGTLNAVETNKATREYLFAKAADNFVARAREENEVYKNEVRGRYESEYSNNMGSIGQSVVQEISNKADVSSEADYNVLMRQMERAYNAAKEGKPDTILDTIKRDIVENYGFKAEDVDSMIRAGKIDSGGNGFTVKASGNVNAETRKALKQFADIFSVNIELTDDIQSYTGGADVNGLFDYATNTIILNSATPSENMAYTAMHELVHGIKDYDMKGYDNLAKAFKTMWTQDNAENFNKTIKDVKERYKKAGKKLNDEQALEEVICSQMGEILHDDKFMDRITEKHFKAGRTLLNAVRRVIRKIRDIFGLGNQFDSRYKEALFSQYNLLKDAEEFLATALHNKKLAMGLGKMVQREGKAYSVNDDYSMEIEPEVDYEWIHHLTPDEYEQQLKKYGDERWTIADQEKLDSLKGTEDEYDKLSERQERVAQLIEYRRRNGLESESEDSGYDDEYDDYIKGFTNIENSEDSELVNELINWNEETKDHKDFKKQSFPRFNPMIKQDNIDTRAEIRETIDSVIEPLKADKKLTHGQVLNAKSVKNKVGDLLHKVVGDDTTMSKKTMRETRDFAVDALTTAYYELQKEHPNMDVVYDVLEKASEEIVDVIDYNYENDEMREFLLVKKALRRNPIYIARRSWGDYGTVGGVGTTEANRAFQYVTVRHADVSNRGVFGQMVDSGKIKKRANSDVYLSEDLDGYTELLFGTDDAITQPRGLSENYDLHNDDSLPYLLEERMQNWANSLKGLSEYDCNQMKKALVNDLSEILIQDAESYKTYADKQKEKYDTMKNRLKGERDALAAKLKDTNDTLEKTKTAAKNQVKKYEKKLESEKTKRKKMIDTREKRIEKLKEKNKAKEEKRKRREEKQKVLYNINVNYAWLSSRLLTKERKYEKNIPQEIRRPLAQALVALDIQTARSVKMEQREIKKTGTPTGAALKIHALREAMREISKEKEYQGMFTENEVLMNNLEVLASINKPMRDMTLEELKVVKDVLKGVRFEITEGQQMQLDGLKQSYKRISDNICNDFEEMIKKYGEAKKFKGAYGLVRDFVNFDNVTPMSFFKNAGGTFSHIWDVLRNSQDKYFQYTKETAEFVETLPGNKRWLRLNGGHSDAQKWQDHRNEIELESGKKIDVSDTQIMSLYLLAKREAAMRHIRDGEGIRVPVINKDTRKIREKVADKVLMRDMTDYETVAVTDADLADMFSRLTQKQKDFANAMQDYLSTVIAERGNKASMEMYGVRLFEEENYFPMYTVQDGKFKNLETGYNGIAGIPDPGWSKNVNEKAENALVIEDCIRVFARHCDEMNLYASSQKALKAITRLLNTGDVSNQMIRAFGVQSIDYTKNIINDFRHQQDKKVDGWSKIINAGMNNYKRAAIAANLSVWAQQYTAVCRAWMEISPKYFFLRSPKDTVLPPKIQSKKRNALIEEMNKYCPITWWKFQGNHELNFSRSSEDIIMNKKSIRDKLAMGVYEAADLRTWLHIWKAVKAETKATRKDLKPGSEEFLKYCGERAAYIFDYTQTVDSPLHRAQIMRDKNVIAKSVSSFKAEPLKTFNIFRDSLIEASRYKKEGKKVKAAKAVTKMATVLTINSFAAAFAKTLIQAMRKTDKAKDEGEPITYLAAFKELFGDNFWSNENPIRQIPGFEELWGVFNTTLDLLSGEEVDYFSLMSQSNITSDWLYSINKALYKYNKKKADNDLSIGDSVDFLNTILAFAGFGFANAKRDVGAITNALGLPDPFAVFADAAEDRVDVFAKKYKEMGGSVPGEPNAVEKKLGGVAEKAAKSNSLFGKLKSAYEKLSTSEDTDDYGFWDDEGLGGRTIKALFRVKEGSKLDDRLDSLGFTRDKKEREKAAFDADVEKALAKAQGKKGEYREEAVVNYIKKDWKKHLKEGTISITDWYKDCERRKKLMKACGVSKETREKFNEAIISETRTRYHKDIEKWDKKAFSRMDEYTNYLAEQGWSKEDISRKMIENSDTAREFKQACKVENAEGAAKSLAKLMDAGITKEDINYLYENRNRVKIGKDSKYYKEAQALGLDEEGKGKATGKYIYPAHGTITSYFGYRNAPTAGASSNHPAIDIAVPEGTRVSASDGGTVVATGWSGGYGNIVQIDHGNGVVTQYSHLSKVGVRRGQKVARGQEVARSGNTGVSTGPHLDFKMMINGEPVDPLKHLTK